MSTGLTAADVAARLGIKRQTVYAYVSRGLLSRRIGPDGRTSLFDPGEVDRLRAGGRNDDGELHTLIATSLTRVDDQTLWIRGQDLIGLVVDGMTFEQAVDLLWATPAAESWAADLHTVPRPEPDRSIGDVGVLDALRVATARCSAHDPLRHELSPRSVRSAGRRLIATLARSLPSTATAMAPVVGTGGTDDGAVAAMLWLHLAAGRSGSDVEPAALEQRVRAVDVALALLVDHGLAGSTFAARIAASVRADPYAVVGAGLGVLGGVLHGGASSAVHELLLEAEHRRDTAAALGRARRRLGYLPGVGHSIYTEQDPRYGALMARLVEAWGDDPRLVSVYRLRDLIGERTDAIPNIDLALGSLTYLAQMPPDAGEAIFAISRTAGWLAHAMEEYEEKPLRFRARAKYTGP